MLNVFMPILIFEGAFAMDVYVLRKIFWQALFMAGPGLGMSFIFWDDIVLNLVVYLLLSPLLSRPKFIVVILVVCFNLLRSIPAAEASRITHVWSSEQVLPPVTCTLI